MTPRAHHYDLYGKIFFSRKDIMDELEIKSEELLIYLETGIIKVIYK